MEAMTDWRNTPLTLRQRYKVRVKFEKRNCWLGVSWERAYPKDPRDPSGRQSTMGVRVYVGLLPCLPLVITRVRGESPR